MLIYLNYYLPNISFAWLIEIFYCDSIDKNVQYGISLLWIGSITITHFSFFNFIWDHFCEIFSNHKDISILYICVALYTFGIMQNYILVKISF